MSDLRASSPVQGCRRQIGIFTMVGKHNRRSFATPAKIDKAGDRYLRSAPARLPPPPISLITATEPYGRGTNILLKHPHQSISSQKQSLLPNLGSYKLGIAISHKPGALWPLCRDLASFRELLSGRANPIQSVDKSGSWLQERQTEHTRSVAVDQSSGRNASPPRFLASLI